MRKEWLARLLVIGAIVLALALPAWGWWAAHQAGPILHARMAETGGWTPENLTAEVGKPLRLRLTSDDVLHSFALGQSDLPPVDVKPGEISEVTLNFDKPGKYVFYCTRWCSLNHWRMRGVIEVSDPSSALPENPEPPLYVRLGLDLDAEHPAVEHLPEARPSAGRGRALAEAIPAEYRSLDYYRAHSPYDLWTTLRGLPSLAGRSDQELWDAVASVWLSHSGSQEIAEAATRYQTNCAACHGQGGAGDGVFADELGGAGAEHGTQPAGEMTQRPTDFTDPAHMLVMSPAHLQGKLLRGGMGTGMPYWGPIFTDEQLWALVGYLWTFQFQEANQP